METLRLNMASIIPDTPKTVKPQFTAEPVKDNTASRWRDERDELRYRMEPSEPVKETTCYDDIIL